VYNRKIILRGGEISNDDSSRYLTSPHPNRALPKKISAAAIRSTCHTVTPVTQISPVHCPNKGLNFILSHLFQPVWPRTVSTNATGGRQVIVNSREEALTYFKAANCLDCRISAYPYWRSSTLSDFVGIKNTIPPNFIMIDLDLSNFNGEPNIIKGTLRKTLYRINHLLSIRPSVIGSGNGYHVYIPISAVVLEDIKEFAGIEQVSTKFLRFAEWYLSSGKSDPAHNSTVSLNNCMLRIPGTYNSKKNAVVKIIRKWDNNRPEITLLLGSFCAYLKDQKLKEQRVPQQNASSMTLSFAESIPWIDRLLQTAVPNGRKYCIWRILVPYLVNRKHLSTEQSTSKIMNWLNECAQVARLDFNPSARIVYALKHVGEYGPVHPGTIEKQHDTLYELLKVQGVL
jgi:Primase X